MMRVTAASCACVDVFVDKKELHPGGEALNFCGTACRYPDVQAYIIAAVGDDDNGRLIRERVRKTAIYPDFLRVIRGGVTANHRIWNKHDGDRYFREDSWCGGVHDTFVLGAEEKRLLLSADVVHTTVDSPVLRQILECRQQRNFLLSVDFNEYRDFDAWEDFLSLVDVFFISGAEDIFPRLSAWSERYHGVFAATLAARGSAAWQGGKEYRCGAVPVENPADTTGAGDSYQAGFMVTFRRNRDIRRAMAEGSRMAAETIRRIGGF